MASAKKDIVARLEAIKQRAAELSVDNKGVDPQGIAQLAEEAAGLGLELAAKGGKT